MSILNSLLPLYQKDSITHFDITVKNGVNSDFCFVIDKELTESPSHTTEIIWTFIVIK